MELLDFPPEILIAIVGFCEPGGAVIKTCRTLADVAFSTPSFWTYVRIPRIRPWRIASDARERLRKRLGRALGHPLTISIGLVEDDASKVSYKEIIEDICLILSEWNAQIDHIDIHTSTPIGSTLILPTIFNDLTPSVVFSALRSLIVVHDDDYHTLWPRFEGQSPYEGPSPLSSVLADLHKKFPSLESLFMAIPCYSMPSFLANETFLHLRTLILDGYNITYLPNICKVTGLLYNTPQLETLWMKQDHEGRREVGALDPVQNWDEYDGTRPIRVVLPHLIRLAVSAHGTGAELLHCLEAPSLQYLHLDCYHDDPTYEWVRHHEDTAAAAIESFASRSSGVRHLAFTLLPATQNVYETLFFGDQGRLLFPKLETLAIHRCLENYGPTEAVLTRLAQEGQKFPLRRLVLRKYEPSFPGQILIQMFQKAIDNAPNEKYELEVDYPWEEITDEEFNTLEEMGVKLFRRREGEAEIREWWVRNYRLIDASDPTVY